jgi:prepilin-type N-terminal cleavage/methylation domain-containing protein
MNTPSSSRHRGFTLLETVIAIGVLAVLLTGFMFVFAPAAAGIRKSINVQEADRLTSTIEQELVTLRTGEPEKTGFEKAFNRIKNSINANDALLVYQYRGSLTNQRADGTAEPVPNVNNKMPGKDYTVQTMVRLRKDNEFIKKDLPAVEGGVYLVKCTQLVFDQSNGELMVGKAGQIQDPKKPSGGTNVDDYPEAVIAFAADFYTLPAKSESYFNSKFSDTFSKVKNPVFSRNLAVRR